MDDPPEGIVFLPCGEQLSFQIVALLDTGRWLGFGPCEFPLDSPEMGRPNPRRSSAGVDFRMGV